LSAADEISRLVTDATNGALAGPDQLVQAFYPELKRIAAARMRRERYDHTWQPTVLVNELYLELVKIKALRPVQPEDPQQKLAFLALAARVMHWLLVRHTRPLSWKAKQEELTFALALDTPGADSMAQLEDLLDKLADIDPQLRSVVELRVFEGLTVEEIAGRLGCSPRTVTRNWTFARHWLQNLLFPGETEQ
jgi:RNA polymerase sigma factor (TIGR02999 family)